VAELAVAAADEVSQVGKPVSSARVSSWEKSVKDRQREKQIET
jgi:hypothetical protein